MDLGLNDRVAFVGGASRGIGRAIARTLLAEGARVVLTGRDGALLDDAERTLIAEFGADRVLALRADLADADARADALARAVDRWARIDCLVANVGSGSVRQGWELGQAEWDAVFRTNLWTSVALAEASLPTMIAAGRGSVIFVASIAGAESLGAPISYTTAKAALIAYANDLARRVGPCGVRVNSVAPGNILFPGGSWERKLADGGDALRRAVEAEVPLRRFGTPDEIADLVAFLASDRASFTTGACYVADGGQTRGS